MYWTLLYLTALYWFRHRAKLYCADLYCTAQWCPGYCPLKTLLGCVLHCPLVSPRWGLECVSTLCGSSSLAERNYSNVLLCTLQKNRIWDTLSLSTCADSSTDTKTNRKVQKKIYIKKIYIYMCHISHFTCHMSGVRCHMPCVACRVSHVTCH